MSGFLYEIECVTPDGEVRWVEKIHNIIPTPALNYLLSSSLNNGARYTEWFIGLYPNNYSPVSNDTMTTLIANAGETTEYDETTRVALTPDGIANGLYSNYTTPSEFSINSNITVRGGFISSNSTKSSTSGLLLSAALFASPRSIVSGETLRVRAGMQLASV